MTSKSTTVAEYLKSLPEDRRRAVSTVRQTILKHLPKGFEEGMQYGMIGYYVPKSIYPPGYHCDTNQPLCFAGLASQKNHMSFYMMTLYGDPKLLAWFTKAFKETGKKLDMGKSCIRFKKLEDLPLELIGEAFGKVSCEEYVKRYEQIRAASKSDAKKAAKAPSGKMAATARKQKA